MKLFKRGNTYYIEFKRGVKRSLKTANKKEAEAIFRQAKTEYLKGRIVALEKSVLLSEFICDYIKSRQSSTSEHTQRLDELSLKLFLDAIGNVPINIIDTQKIEKFKEICQARGCKAVSINSYLRHIKAALNTSCEAEIIKKVPKIKMCSIGERLHRFLKKDEIDKLLAYIKEKDFEFYRLILAYLWTGARRNELLGLQWQHCNLDAEKPYALIIGKRNKQRLIPLMQPILDILMPIKKDIGFVFVHLYPDTVSHYFKKYSRACGIDCRLHDLRHTAATYMLASGVNIRYVQEILGHSSMATTQIYTHAISDKMHDEMSKMKL